MLADFLTWIWPALPMFLFAGCCFVLAGGIWLFFIRRHEQVMPQIPPVDEPATVAITTEVKPEANYRRADDDTRVITPGIPGATPPLTPQLAAVARYLDDVDAVAMAATVVHDELVLAPIEGLRHIPSPDLGPVCPFCGAPFHAVCPSAPKNAPEQTQVVDLCPLTTQDIEIDSSAPHFAETFTRHPRAELGTQELSGSLARAKESAA